MNQEPTSCYFCGSFDMYQGAFIQNIEKFEVFVCVECLKKELGLNKYGEPMQMNFNDKTPVEPSKCLCIHALDGYETYKIDDNTIGVRPIWIPFKENDSRLENHSSYIVTDGRFVTEAYYDVNEFVGCEEDIVGEITHWMNWPKPPSKL